MAGMMHVAPKKFTTTSNRARKSTTDETRFPTEDEIALRARRLYEKSGSPGGRDVEFWLEAERQVGREINS
jgi:hypothetical protein